MRRMMAHCLLLIVVLLVPSLSFAGRSSIATDTFTSMGNFTVTSGGFTITAGNQFYGTYSGIDGLAYWSGAGSFSNDQYSKITISGLSWLGTNFYVGAACRASADADPNHDAYYIVIHGDAGGPNYTTEIGKIVNGTRTSLHSTTVAWATNDTLSIECVGTTITGFKNDVSLGGSFVQTGQTDLASGKPGVMARGADDRVIGDNFDGGDVTSSTDEFGFRYRRRQ